MYVLLAFPSIEVLGSSYEAVGGESQTWPHRAPHTRLKMIRVSDPDYYLSSAPITSVKIVEKMYFEFKKHVVVQSVSYLCASLLCSVLGSIQSICR